MMIFLLKKMSRPFSFRPATLLFLLAVVPGFFSCGSQEKEPNIRTESYGSTQATPTEGRFYSIKKFVDGDTFWLEDGSPKGIKIRLIGIDTPETRNTRRKKKHPMGKMVADYVQQLLQNKQVRVELDVRPLDQYGRILAYVYTETDMQLNAHLIEIGYAQLMTVPPNVKFVDTYIKLQQKARETQRGLWKEGFEESE